MTEKIKAAVIGLGVGTTHGRGYKACADSELVAVCDIDPVRLKERGDLLEIPTAMRFTDYKEMLKLPGLDVVSVALPNYLHAPVAIDALRAGKHVLSEKPLSTSAAEAQTIVDAAKACGRQLMVCFNYRFRDDTRWLRGFRDAGKLGELYYARAGWLRNTGIPGAGGWFTTKSKSGGGPLIDLGVHILDLTLWMMGYPRPISVSGATFSKFGPRGKKSWASRASTGPASYFKEADSGPIAFDVEDLAGGFVRFDNGAALQIEASWGSHTKPGKDDYFITLYGTEGGSEMYVANYTDRDTLTVYTEEAGEPVAIKPAIVNHTGAHENAIKHFVYSVKNNLPVEATGEQGVALMRIIDALYASAASGKEIRLDK